MAVLILCRTFFAGGEYRSGTSPVEYSGPLPTIDEEIADRNRTFDDLAFRSATPDGYVIFTTFQNDFHLWVSNWLTFLTKVRRYRNTIAIAVRREECERLWAQNLRCFPHQDLLERGTNYHIPLDPRINKTDNAVVLKWYYTLRVIQLGLTPIFSDADVVFLRDPLLLPDKRFDIFGLSDFCRPIDRRIWKLNPTGCHLYHRKEPCQSTGLVVYENTEATRRFLIDMWNELLHTDEWEQALANYKLVDHVALGLRHRLMDDHIAANCLIPRQLVTNEGRQWSAVMGELVALHVGYVHETGPKASVYRDIHLWFDDPDYKKYRLLPPELETLPHIYLRTGNDMPSGWCSFNDCLWPGPCSPPKCVWDPPLPIPEGILNGSITP